MNKKNKIILLSLSFILTLILCQLSDYFAYLSTNYYLNKQIVFGTILNNYLAAAITTLGIIAIFIALRSFNKNPFWLIILSAAGLSNLGDRIIYAGVIDYIKIFRISIINIADIIIVVAIIFQIFGADNIKKTPAQKS